MVALVKQLFERRIPEVVAIYAGALLGLIEFIGGAVPVRGRTRTRR